MMLEFFLLNKYLLATKYALTRPISFQVVPPMSLYVPIFFQVASLPTEYAMTSPSCCSSISSRHTYIHTFMSTYISIYILVYIPTYIYTYIHISFNFPSATSVYVRNNLTYISQQRSRQRFQPINFQLTKLHDIRKKEILQS